MLSTLSTYIDTRYVDRFIFICLPFDLVSKLASTNSPLTLTILIQLYLGTFGIFIGFPTVFKLKYELSYL